MKEHFIAVKKKQPEKSALAEHCLRSDHCISWESAKILRRSDNWSNRQILEGWEINVCNNPINRDDGIHLPSEYLSLTLKDKK